MSSEGQRDPRPVFAVLGPLRLLGPTAQPVELKAEKQRRLLAALLLSANDWVPVDRLIDQIWPEGAPASARGNVKTYIHQTRQVLPPVDGDDLPRIESRRGSYRLNVRPGEFDIELFEAGVRLANQAFADGDARTAGDAATTALALWRGEPYEQLAGERAEAERTRLTELRWVARYRAADALLAGGEADEAVVFLRPLTVEEPLREGTWERLIRALREAGRRADALEAYREIRQVLVAELGAEPGAGLREQQRLTLAEASDTPPEAEPKPADDSTRRPESPTDQRRRWWHPRRPVVWVAAGLALVVLAGGLFYGISAARSPTERPRPTADAMRKRPVPGITAPGSAGPRLLFGIGEQAVQASETELAETTPIGMFTTWYDEPEKLAMFAGWKATVIPAVYRQGKAHHLLVTSWDKPGPLKTKYGPGCGQAYPLSDRYLDDMRQLATSFAGPANGPPLFVSMFDGPEKLACTVDGYRTDPLTTAYFRAIKDRYREVLRIFHETAPNARVGLNWNGWQASSDHPDTGGGRSMFPFFDDIMRASDFQSFSAFEEEDNAADIRAMTKLLGRYGPVMLSYYKPFKNTTSIFDHDVRLLLNEPALRQLTADGLFAWSFEDDDILDASPESYAFVKSAVQRFSRSPAG